jgi:carboxyl-terminal processing protease
MFFNKKNLFQPAVILVLFVLIFYAGFFVGKNQVVCKICKPEKIDFSLFWEAYNTLSKNFIDPSKIDNQKILYGAIEGMAESLGDPYTSFFDPEQAKKFNDDLSGSFTGIGVEVGIRKKQLTVVAPLEGTPGQRAGLKPGDLILKIDGKDSLAFSTEEAVSLIRGPKGTEVVLTIFREGWQDTKDIKIIRDLIKVPSMKWEIKNNDIAYIKIYQFDQTLSDEFKKTAFEISNSSAKKIILDLRNNPGGYLAVAQDIAGWFLERGEIVTIEDFGKDKEQIIYKAEGSSALSNYPVIILINEGSASASEILAGALRDNRGIKLIGEKSFGKGSVQEVRDLAGGSFLKITVAKWLTPKKALISEVGLTPDIKIDPSETEGQDPQLQKALEIVGSLK